MIDGSCTFSKVTSSRFHCESFRLKFLIKSFAVNENGDNHLRGAKSVQAASETKYLRLQSLYIV